jgi:hypothetical protein
MNANNLINDPNYVPLSTDGGAQLLVTDPGSGAPDGVFIVVSSSLTVKSGGRYPSENRRSWLLNQPVHVKR